MAKKPNKNPDAVVLFTPPGSLKWPKLTEVDYGTTQYPDKDGSLNTRIVFDGSDTKVSAFTAKLDKMMERSKELAQEKFDELPTKARKLIEGKTGGIVADPPYSPVYDEDTDEETGEIEMRFKRKASGVLKNGPKKGKKWFASIDLFDSANPPKPLPEGVEIWGGSVAVINAEFVPYFVEGTGAYGIQRMLRAVQIVDLVSSGGQRSAASYGFEGSDDGFDGSTASVKAKDGDDDDDDGGDVSSDDDDMDADF